MANKKARAARKILNLQPVKANGISSAMKTFTSVKHKVSQMAQNAIAIILRNRANNRYHYGEFDNLPNIIIAAVDNSGTATACVNRLSQFIQADGFIAEGLNLVKANSKQSLGNILAEQAQNVSYLKGYALRLIFDVEGKIKKIYSIDVKTLRKVGPNFEFNPLMGEVGKDEGETRVYPEFDIDRDPAERRRVIAEQVRKYGEQLGEILYVFKKGMGRYYDVYPVPDYYSSIEDVISDGKISQLDLRNITQGFRTPVIISTGPIDDQNEDEDGNTAQDYFDQALESFTGEDASPILHLKGATDEFKPSVTVINLAEILDQTEKTSERIAKRVARNMGVPGVLIGISTEGKLGDVQELKNQMSLFALSVYHLQALIKEGYDQIKPFLALKGMEAVQDLDFTISTLRPFDFIPESVIANLSVEEQKEMFEIDLESSQPVPVDPTDIIKSQTYNDYPKAASENAQAALRWAEENGWGSCGTDVGKQRANQLAKGESISRETIARMAAFERHRQNSNKPLGDGCGRLMWLAWGGDEGVEWAQRKLEQIDNE